MKFDQQVCNLELAEQLKELGVKQKSLFVWSVSSLTTMEPEITTLIYAASIHGKGIDCSAFTVAELGEMLPSDIVSYTKLGMGYAWQVHLEMLDDDFPPKLKEKNFQSADNEADARAKMLIYLLEHKIITL